MTSRDFCFWLQGYFEIGAGDMGNPLNGQQVDAIRRHLALVFKHEIAPAANGEKKDAETITRAAQLAALDRAHKQEQAMSSARVAGQQLARSGCGVGGQLIC